MYDVAKMKREYSDAVKVVRSRIEDEFVAAFEAIYRDSTVAHDLGRPTSLVERTEILTTSDIDKVFREAGFYVILTDYPVEGNNCRLRMEGLRAVYRGECATTRLRVLSHLANPTYRAGFEARSMRYTSATRNAGKLFHEKVWPHCLKLDGSDGPSGINIEEPRYANFRWSVLVHRMNGSSQDIRRIAETAFDRAFGKPAASRENEKKRKK